MDNAGGAPESFGLKRIGYRIFGSNRKLNPKSPSLMVGETYLSQYRVVADFLRLSSFFHGIAKKPNVLNSVHFNNLQKITL